MYYNIFMNKTTVFDFPFVKNDLELFTHLESMNGDTTPHQHTYYEIFYITSKTANHFCNGKTQNLVTGDCFLLRPRDVHHFIRPPQCTHRDILSSGDLMKRCCDFIDDTFFDKINSEPSPRFISLNQNELSFIESFIEKTNLQTISSNNDLRDLKR